MAPTSSRADNGLEGTWTGTYTCNGHVAQLTLRNAGAERVFEFSYPDGTAGSFSVEVEADPKKRRVKVDPVAWIDQPPGFHMVGLNGRLSKDGKTISGRVTGGCEHFTIRNPDAVPAVADDGGTVKAEEEQEVAEAAGARPDKSPPVPSSWEADLACHHLRAIRVSFQDPDDEGYDVLVRVLEPKAVDYTVLRARSAPGRHDFGLQITAEPAPTGRLARDPLVLTTSPMIYPGKLTVNVRSPNCGEARLLPAKEDVAVPDQDLPPELAALVGAWDGAAYFKRSSKAIAVSLVISPSGSMVKGRLLDAEMTVDGVAQPSALFGDGERIELKPIERSRMTYDAGIYTRLKDGGPHGEMIRGVLQDREPLSLYLWRRPAGEARPLAELCAGNAKDFGRHRKQGLDAAVWLKREFHPAFETMDPEAEADRETRLAAAGTQGADAVLRQAALCAVTAPSAGAPDALAMAALAGIERFDLVREDLAFGHPARAVAGTAVVLPDAEAATAAEAALRDEVAKLGKDADPAAILAAVAKHRKLIDAARPSEVRRILSPWQLRLRVAETAQDAGAAEARAKAAKAIMAGLEVPPLPPAQAGMIAEVSEGRRSGFDQAEILFLAGTLAESSETCKALDPAVGLRLSGLMMQGTTLALGTDYANPDLLKSMGSLAGNTALFVEGVDFVRGVGCRNAWLAGFYQALALAVEGRSEGKTSSTFLRSCAVHHPTASCGCAMGVLEPFFPGIANREYDRSMLEQVIRMNPGAGLVLFAQCQIGDY